MSGHETRATEHLGSPLCSFERVRAFPRAAKPRGVTFRLIHQNNICMRTGRGGFGQLRRGDR
eukprot:scaffold843_cov255-Pinguiococcus_pyrenoidosus.AAC.6